MLSVWDAYIYLHWKHAYRLPPDYQRGLARKVKHIEHAYGRLDDKIKAALGTRELTAVENYLRARRFYLDV